jgi:hypothetical protein
MTNLNIIGNIQDPINTLSGRNRKFIFNRGSYDAKRELWDADLLEIIETEITEGSYDYLCTSDGDEILTSLGERIIIHL